VWLRQHRHELFDDDFQAELAAAYQESPKGQPPVAPAQLGLATILQAYTGASDDEVIEATVMDRRWQLVLDCLDVERSPFAKGTLVGFRARLVAAELDRRLVERTVALAKAKGGFGDRALRAALDASPLWGAGRVETPSTCWVTPCARRWASSRGSRGGGCRGTRASPRWPTRPAWGCLAPRA
jgi:transposase